MSKRELAYKYARKFKPSVFDSGIGARLPKVYRKFYDEWRSTPEPVHYTPYTGNIWVRDDTTGEIKRMEDVPIPVQYPKELHEVFTGGEGVVQGFLKKKKFNTRVPRFWVPRVYRSVIYTEILDKYMSVLMTNRVVELIHKHQGLDTYILKTKACDLQSLIALKLKRKLLFALNNKELPYNEEKNNEIFQKYKEYLIPAEEIEWYGLSFSEACRKQKEIEEHERSVQPFKHFYRAQLIKELSESKIDEPTEKKPVNWYQKIIGGSKLTKDQ